MNLPPDGVGLGITTVSEPELGDPSQDNKGVLDGLCRAIQVSLEARTAFINIGAPEDFADTTYMCAVFYSVIDAFKHLDILSPCQCNILEDLSKTNLPTYVGSMTLNKREECMKFLLKIAQDSQPTFDVESFFRLSIFTVSTANGSVPTIKDVYARSSKEATLSAWDSDYKGNASTVLWRYIHECCQKTPFNAPRLYARYFSIVQSSGMGKSRLVDEVSKRHFTIQLCLRDGGTGFPPADTDVLQYLRQTHLPDESEHHANTRIQAFLTALFLKTAEWINARRHHGKDKTRAAVAVSFRKFMTEGQAFDRRGPQRNSFFVDVISCAKHLETCTSKCQDVSQGSPDPAISWDVSSLSGIPLPKGIPSADMTIQKAAQTMTSTLQAFPPDQDEKEQPTKSDPLALLSFDEAHSLNRELPPNAQNSAENQPDVKITYFFCLRRQLRKLRDEPIFSVFLSTTGAVFQFTPAKVADPSARVSQGTLQLRDPFTDLGFDLLMEPIQETKHRIGDLTKMDFLVNFGRPLFATRYHKGNDEVKRGIITFAAEKLLNLENWQSKINDPEFATNHKEGILACLACRLGLEFDPSIPSATARELVHVERHMRVCLQPNVEDQFVISKAPSEPVLCEAARLVMQSCNFHPAHVLASEFSRPDIMRGPRGETTMNLLITLTSDWFVTNGEPRPWKVVDFLEALFNSPRTQTGSSLVHDALPSTIHPGRSNITANTPLSKTFRHDTMYISHFIKAKSFDVVDRNCLWALTSRHAGLECPNGQRGIDILLPFVRKDKHLGRSTVSFIIIQVKNDQSFKDVPHVALFDAMNPYTVKLFSPDDRDAKRGGPPIIRIVAALASPKSAVINFRYDSPEPKSMAKVDKEECASRDYTAYDFWCAGLSPEVWGPINPDNVSSWRQLLDASGSKGVTYNLKDKDRERLRRSQGIAEAGIDETGHWSWIARDDTYIDTDIEDEIDADVSD